MFGDSILAKTPSGWPKRTLARCRRGSLIASNVNSNGTPVKLENQLLVRKETTHGSSSLPVSLKMTYSSQEARPGHSGAPVGGCNTRRRTTASSANGGLLFGTGNAVSSIVSRPATSNLGMGPRNPSTCGIIRSIWYRKSTCVPCFWPNSNRTLEMRRPSEICVILSAVVEEAFAKAGLATAATAAPFRNVRLVTAKPRRISLSNKPIEIIPRGEGIQRSNNDGFPKSLP